MKLPLLFLVFIPLTIAASQRFNRDLDPFCSKGCPYLKSMGENAKINFKKLDEKCKTDPKIPKCLCGKRPQEAVKFMEKQTWAELCSEWCDV